MQITPSRELKIGAIVEGTLEVIELCKVPVAIFIIALTIINGVVAYYTVENTAVLQALAKSGINFVVGVVAAYQLLEALLRKTGNKPAGGDDVFLAYCGLSVLYTLGVLAGFILLILPGLFVMARWIIAQPLLLSRRGGVVDSLKESWERTSGSEFPILVAMLSLVFSLIIVSALAGYLFEQTDPIGIGISQLAASCMSAVSMAMGVAIFQQIVVARDKANEGKVDPRIGA
ncbi:hypothetical protein GRI89_02450 [Altererythrobacter salegens]|uniref:Glycerophosphoryl diester phosphodiesterase membrane domain-containing protein n=1 Tax=Croceibacterium salegens TaxID=1737568 RepID=A0A6I4STM2_9SPHN|nr:hypothetical protein [Croceibacterium salegens]MXO58407.1 hypothetical protein [Croceibacterium salegens]